MNKLRKIFSTEVDETTRQQVKAMIDRAYDEKWCCTCKHYVPDDPYTPGFITSGSDCALTGRAAMETCPRYDPAANKYDGLDWLSTPINPKSFGIT